MNEETRIEAAILQAVTDRGMDKSICPSEVARVLAPEWRPILSATRRAAIRLAIAGRIDILRKGQVVDPKDVRGVIRLRMRPEGAAAEAAPSTETGADEA